MVALAVLVAGLAGLAAVVAQVPRVELVVEADLPAVFHLDLTAQDYCLDPLVPLVTYT